MVDSLNLLQNVTILYIEDEAITRDIVVKFLKKKVGRVILAENGHDGIEKFMEYKPDIIITDLIMPDMSGIEMMREIRKKGFKSPVIITSALSDSKTILETVDLKIEKYIIKPIDVCSLLKAIIDIATEEIENNKNLLVINNEFILADEKKQEFELEIRNLYSKYLKKIAGKGARNIRVFIKGKEIEILSKDNLTTIEENLLLAGTHGRGVEIIRQTVYEHTKNEIEEDISNLLNRTVEVKQIDIYAKQRFERILLQVN